MDDYLNSIAQEDVSFSTAIVLATTPGDNFYKLMIFVGLTEVGESLVASHATPALVTITAANFATETKGLLLKWLTAFYASQNSIPVYINIFTDEVTGDWNPAGLTLAYNTYKALSYWKAMLYYPKVGEVPTLTEQDPVAYLALALLQKTDTQLTGPILVNEYDAAVFTTPATTISGLIKAAGSDAFSAYHPEALDTAPAYVQLGITLGQANDTGTPVGNDLDYVANNVITASGTDDANLDPTKQAALKAINIGYYKTLGNGTGYVALVGGKSLQGNYLGADWVTQYNDYVNEIKVAELLTRMNIKKNKTTYSTILAIMEVQINKFGDIVGTGRLTDILITAPIYSKLPTAAGDTIVVPHAWEATYVDKLRKVQVYGTLTIPV